MATSKGVRDAFVPYRPPFTLDGNEYTIKITSSFNFHEMAELGAIQDAMEAVLEQAKEAGDVDEDGDPNINRVKYALPLAELNFKRMLIHIQSDELTLEDMKSIDGEEIKAFQDFLTEQEEARVAEMEKEAGLKEQKAVLRQKKNTGQTS